MKKRKKAEKEIKRLQEVVMNRNEQIECLSADIDLWREEVKAVKAKAFDMLAERG